MEDVKIKDKSLDEIVNDYLESKRAARYALGAVIKKSLEIASENKDVDIKLGLIIAAKDLDEISQEEIVWDSAASQYAWKNRNNRKSSPVETEQEKATI